ncbi:helix-turn-helix domain-containing protein [Leifsonia sp. NPDC058230]|uniref:helix-turn-helix domain-containing protein n=1 Tax=Leifsonia sp. NPDC058230 TaxID=3346391 RepID=UPI0036DE0A27
MSDERGELRGMRVLAHPLRLRLLSLLGGTALSAAEAARALDDTQANVSYHLRRLHEAGLVYVAEEVPIRGGRAKRYRHDPTSGEGLTSGDGGLQALMGAMAAELTRRASSHAEGTPTAFTDAEFWVPDGAWQRVMELVREAGVVLADAAAAPGAPGTRPVAATLALFELAAPGPAAAAGPAAASESRQIDVPDGPEGRSTATRATT